jgi:hypothetical protein
MRSVRTARGKTIDMAALAAKNETARSVGNVMMNGRGDRLNLDGSIKYTAEEIARADAAQRTPPVSTPISDPKPIMQQPDPEPEPEVELPEVVLEPEAVSKITRTRDDGSKYAEIEYDDGSIETVELDEE